MFLWSQRFYVYLTSQDFNSSDGTCIVWIFHQQVFWLLFFFYQQCFFPIMTTTCQIFNKHVLFNFSNDPGVFSPTWYSGCLTKSGLWLKCLKCNQKVDVQIIIWLFPCYLILLISAYRMHHYLQKIYFTIFQKILNNYILQKWRNH